MSATSDPKPARAWLLAKQFRIRCALAAFALVTISHGCLYWRFARYLEAKDEQYLTEQMQRLKQAYDYNALQREIDRSESPHLLYYIQFGDRKPFTHVSPGWREANPMSGVLYRSGTSAEQMFEHRNSRGQKFLVRTYHSQGGFDNIALALDRAHNDDLLAGYRRQMFYVLGLSLFVCGLIEYIRVRRVRLSAQAAADPATSPPTPQ